MPYLLYRLYHFFLPENLYGVVTPVTIILIPKTTNIDYSLAIRKSKVHGVYTLRSQGSVFSPSRCPRNPTINARPPVKSSTFFTRSQLSLYGGLPLHSLIWLSIHMLSLLHILIASLVSQNTNLDRTELSLCVSLIENGVNPDALAVSSISNVVILRRTK
jgi:hypothetical protein